MEFLKKVFSNFFALILAIWGLIGVVYAASNVSTDLTQTVSTGQTLTADWVNKINSAVTQTKNDLQSLWYAYSDNKIITTHKFNTLNETVSSLALDVTTVSRALTMESEEWEHILTCPAWYTAISTWASKNPHVGSDDVIVWYVASANTCNIKWGYSSAWDFPINLYCTCMRIMSWDETPSQAIINDSSYIAPGQEPVSNWWDNWDARTSSGTEQ